MPTPSESIRLTVGGVVNEHWSGWSVDSDLLVPADAFELEVYSARGSQRPAEVVSGASCQLRLGDDTVLTGRLDEVEEEVSRTRHVVRIMGRDLAGFLVDCSTPFVSMRDASLQQIIDEVVKPMGISRVHVKNQGQALRRRIQLQPGQSAWEAVQQVAEASGTWPWMDPDGTLIIGQPDYGVPVVGRLQLRYDGQGNNVETLSIREGIAQRFSEITVLGQHGAFDADDWGSERVALKSKIKDDALARRGIFRPRIVVDGACDSNDLAASRAKKLLGDSQMEGFDMRAVVKGWRTDNGAVWTPGQRVHVRSEPHDVDDVYFLMGRTLRLTRQHGAVTELRFREDKTWIVGARERKTRSAKTADDGDQHL